MRPIWLTFDRDLVCRDAVELVNDYLEDALTPRARRRLERHLADCPHCTAYLEQMRATVRLTGRLVPEDIPAELQQDFLDVFRSWRDEERRSADSDGSSDGDPPGPRK